MREPDGVKKTALAILGGVHYLECTRYLNGDLTENLNVPQPNKDVDGVYVYATELLTLGLLWHGCLA